MCIHLNYVLMLIELVIVKQTEILIQATKLNDSNMIRTHNHLLCKKTLNRFTSLAHSAQEYFEKSAFKKKQNETLNLTVVSQKLGPIQSRN